MCVYIRTCLKSKYDMQRDTGRNKERERERESHDMVVDVYPKP